MPSALKTAFVILVVVTLAASVTLAQEKPVVKEPSTPEAVLKSFEKSYPNAKVVGYDSDTTGKQTLYEIETIVDSMEKDYIYLEDGTLLYIEEEITLKQLPAKVIESIKKAHPDCEMDEAEKITRGEVIEYAIEIEVGDKEFELLVSSDGTILSTEDEADEDEEDDDGDDDEEEEEEAEDDDK